MKCYDLFKLPSLAQLKVVAGTEGLSREISWIHFVDNMNPEDYPVQVEEYDLIIATGCNLNNNFEPIISIIPQLTEKHIAGILFCVGRFISEIPENLIELANELRLPVFVIPWGAKLGNISKEICSCIFSGQTTINQQSKFLNEILFNENLSKEELTRLILNVDFNFQMTFHMGVIQYKSTTKNTSSTYNDNRSFSTGKLLYNQFKSQIEIYGCTLAHIQHNDSIIFMIEAENLQPDFSFKMMALQKILHQHFPDTDIFIGVSNLYSSPYDCKQGYFEALRTSNVALSQNKAATIVYYNHIGIHRLLACIDEQQELKKYYYDIFEPILEYDKLNNTDLMETLFCYLNHSLHHQETAAALFIHKSTLKYRINKLESIFQSTLDNPNLIAEIMIAKNIGNLLGIKQHDI